MIKLTFIINLCYYEIMSSLCRLQFGMSEMMTICIVNSKCQSSFTGLVPHSQHICQ